MDVPSSDVTSRPAVRWAAGLIAVAALAAYHNSFSLPFIFDDHPSITGNPTLQSFATALSPPTDGRAVTGRPLVNLSLALNRALGGDVPHGYHVFNFLVHAAAALLLFGLVRRTIGRAAPAAGARPAAAIGLFTALLWALHPLQTESITFVIQRTESLVGLFYLLTLYGFVRGVDSACRGRWFAASIVACALGMATKEVMVTAPLVVLLYDRTFIARSFAEAWRRRGRYHGALAATWLVLLFLLLTQHGSSRAAAGSFDPAVNGWTYLLKQCDAIVHYLQLAVWPHPLVVDYGTGVVRQLAAVFPQAVLLVGLLGATVRGLRRAPVAGFAGACFFLILAPSSSFVPLPAQTMAEHRMYLPLAAMIAAGVTGTTALLGARRTAAVVVVAGAALALLTVNRNEDYRSEERIWRDALAKLPDNWRAHYNLGWALEREQRYEPARVELAAAIRLKPTHAESHAELGAVLLHLERLPEAIVELRRALELLPANADARHNLGYALLKAGRPREAADEFAVVLRQRDDWLAHLFRAKALVLLRQPDDAIPEYLAAIARRPDNAIARREAGVQLLERGRETEARAQLDAALRLDPRYAEAHMDLGTLLLRAARPADAIASYQAALRLNPNLPGLHNNLGLAYARIGAIPEAVAQFQRALAQDPADALAQEQLKALANAKPIPSP